MSDFDLDRWVARSGALDLSDIDWDAVPAHPVAPAAARVLRYMQDIESHTIVYVRQLLATRAIDDPEVATFLACWFHEETFHGLALDRFLAAAGCPTGPRPGARSEVGLVARLEELAIALVSRAWPDFVAVHMTWGAINELTTLTGYRRLAAIAGHPVLTELLARIIRDESRHFFFYFKQAERRLANPRVARAARFIIERFWAPVGSGVQPAAELRFLAATLLGGAEGEAAARKVDDTIRRLPGMEGLPLLGAWIERETAGAAPPMHNRRILDCNVT
ncbi:MAG: hypothetical protein ACREVS_01695 [Burkholderiales bacterium]